MLDTLKALFKKELQFSHLAATLNHVANLTAICNENYFNDKNGKNSAIDSICAILQTHKDTETTTSTETNEKSS